MSAWPEAIYIINKLNKAFENTIDFEQNIVKIEDINRQIDNLIIKMETGGQVKETSSEYRASNNISAFETVTVKATAENLNKELFYSEINQQTGLNVITAELTIPTGILPLANTHRDFSYHITDEGEAELIYIYSDYYDQRNFNTEPPNLDDVNYDLYSLSSYLIAQDTFLDAMVQDLNERLTQLIEDNHLEDLANLVTNAKSKMAFISVDVPIETTSNPLSDYSVWLKVSTT